MYFGHIKRCNEVIFSGTYCLIYEYSGRSPIRVELSDPAKPTDSVSEALEETGDLGDNDEPETMSDGEADDNVVDEVGEEEEEERLRDEDVGDFRCTITNCAVTTKPLKVRELRRRGSTVATEERGTPTEHLIQFIDEEDELICMTCDRMFLTGVERNQHTCKGAKYTIDIVSVGLRHALQLINDGRVDFIDTRMRDDIANSENMATSDQTTERMSYFKDNTGGCISEIFNQGWAKREAYGNIYGAKYITRYKDEIDALFLKGCEDNRNKMGL